jgi:hypothetical protein
MSFVARQSGIATSSRCLLAGFEKALQLRNDVYLYMTEASLQHIGDVEIAPRSFITEVGLRLARLIRRTNK